MASQAEVDHMWEDLEDGQSWCVAIFINKVDTV